jgi:AraC-like DNA-binding protein
MTHKKTKLSDIGHHIKGLRPALQVMTELGFSHEECLAGTDIKDEQLNNPDMGISLEQEFAFYRRLIALTQNPLIGLKLGQAYRLESYGVFGYAILSAPTLRDALRLAEQYGELSFSHFRIRFEIKDKLAYFQMHQRHEIPTDLLGLYEDRDASAILAGTLSALGGATFKLHHIKLMHNSLSQENDYETLFNCPVSFNHSHLEIAFDAAILKQTMPLRDPDTAEYCRKQCEVLLKKLNQTESWQDLVQEQLIQRKQNQVPSIKEIALALNTSERSLRRKLNDEGTTFQKVLNGMLYQQAKDLLDSDLSLECIAHELGYSEAANFSHAFKRWAGVSPAQYRRSHP